MENNINIAIRAALEAGRKIIEIYDSEDFQISEKSDSSPLTKADRAAHTIILTHLKTTGFPLLSEEGRDTPFSERSGWTTFWMVDPLDGTKEFIKRNGEFTVNIALIQEGIPLFGVVYAPLLRDLYIGIVGEGAWLVRNASELIDIAFVRRGGVRLMRGSGRGNSEGGDHGPDIAPYRVVASRSHLNGETELYLERLKAEKGEMMIVSRGSSLKLCMVAAGEADEYPRMGPTMEWDVAAAHAVVKASGKYVWELERGEDGSGGAGFNVCERELRYNKENLLNPWFLVK